MTLLYQYVAHVTPEPDAPFHCATSFITVQVYDRRWWRRDRTWKRGAFRIKGSSRWRWLNTGVELDGATSDLFDDFVLAANVRRDREADEDEDDARRPLGNVYRFPARKRP